MDAGQGAALLRRYQVDGWRLFFDHSLVWQVRQAPEELKVRRMTGAVLVDLVDRLPVPNSITVTQLADYLGLTVEQFITEIVEVVAG